MATFSFEADAFESVSAKLERASVRANNLHIKRSELTRARGTRDWVWGSRVENSKPHHCARAAARTCLARGAVEAQEDMPSVVHMSHEGKTLRRKLKPAVAHRTHVCDDSKVKDAEEDTGDVTTTADEGFDGFETESPQESPAGGPQDVPREIASELNAWPALPLTAEAPQPAVSSGPVPYREVARRFAAEGLQAQAALERRRAKRAVAARAAREATAWRTAIRRRRQKAAKKAQQQTEVKVAEARPVPATEDFDIDHDEVKMMRATARANDLHMKRSELSRARSARDWVWGSRIEDFRPHHSARAAARTCLARGTVEAQEDMPSIVRLGSTGKGPRRKPAVAHRTHVQDAHDDHDSALDAPPADEGGEAEGAAPPQEAISVPACAKQEPVPEMGAFPVLPGTSAAPAGAVSWGPARK